MDAWDFQTVSGAEQELHETLLALERLLRCSNVRPKTRIVLSGASQALRRELAASVVRSRPARASWPR